MHPFATNFASGRSAPLTFDRLANPAGHVPTVADGGLRLAVQRGAYASPVRPGWEGSERCEVREPGKVPLGILVHHTFVLRLGQGFPVAPLRMVVAQMKLNGGESPLFALRVHQGRIFADWRLPGFSVEHHDRLPGCARDWTRFDLISSAEGAELAEKRLEVHYQPQADAVTGEIVGCEALARWTDPLRGVVPPSIFVPLAEECGHIRSLGEWVLCTACAEAMTWPKGLRVGVNLSPLQVQADLPALVASILLETGLPPERLELEITEGLLIKEPERAIAVLGQLKALGVTIALDDFGTGYSSLSYLQTFEFDRIKIDRSFVAQLLRQPEAEAIIRAILAMTRSLCVASIAEGIETVQQLAALQREQCQEVQGYLIGRPMPALALADFIRNAEIRGASEPA